MRILAINPGSTSTKVGLFDDREQVLELTLRHSAEELAEYSNVLDQFAFRKQIIVDALREASIEISSIGAVIGRGGLLKPIRSGTYEINDRMRNDLKNSPMGQHASNLGGLLADEIARQAGARAFIADPVVVDEMQSVARVTGLPQIERKSIFHALNQKAIARRYAAQRGRKYEDINLIVAHLGGGISVGAHRRGEVVDVNNALNGDGPFSPERTGSIPAQQLVDLCFSGAYTPDQMRKMLCGEGGLCALLGTNDVREARRRAEQGDLRAQEVLDAMYYNIAKWIGQMAVVLRGEIDGIILTGGIAHSETVCQAIAAQVSFLCPVTVMPGEDELEALALNALSVMTGESNAQNYT